MTSYRHKMLNTYSYLPIVWSTFLSFRYCRLSRYSAIPQIPLGWPANATVQEYTCRQGTIWVRKTIFCSLLEIFKQQHLIYNYLAYYSCFFTRVTLVGSRNFRVYNLILLKNFHVFNFCRLRVPMKIFNLENFPNYGNAIFLYQCVHYILLYTHACTINCFNACSDVTRSSVQMAKTLTNQQIAR